MPDHDIVVVGASAGGVAVVQDPEDALYPGMPGNALEHVDVDHVLPAAAMGALLARLAVEPAAEPPGPAPTDMEVEVEVEGFSLEAMEGERPGEPSGFSCPDCHGVFWGDRRRRPAAVPLPGRPRQVAREPPHPAERVAGGGPVGRPAQPGGAGGAVATASPPPASRSRPARPSRPPGWSATCCWTATASPPPGR